MAAATVTGKAIRQALAEQVGGWVFLGKQTGAGAANYIEDTLRLKGNNLPASLFDNCIVRVGSGARAGERVYVDYLDPTTGFLYVTPNLTGVLASGDEYEVWLRGVDPDVVDRLRDDALSRFCSQWRPIPLSWVQDGDMESSGVTAWTIAGGATRTKNFSTFPDAHSRRELSVVHTTAATDYVSSASVFVNPGERFFLQVPVRAYVTATSAAATASINVLDVTHTANITIGGLKTSHIGRGPGWISFLFTVPAGCYEVQLQLKSDTAASTTVWGPIALLKRQKTRVSLPDRITTKKRVGHFYEVTQINPAQSEQADFQFKYDHLNIERVQVGSQVEVYFVPTLAENMVIFYERGFYDRLCSDYFTASGRSTGDLATTDCAKEYIVAALAARVAEFYMGLYGDDWRDDYARAMTELASWEGEFGPEPILVEENETPVSIPIVRV